MDTPHPSNNGHYPEPNPWLWPLDDPDSYPAAIFAAVDRDAEAFLDFMFALDRLLAGSTGVAHSRRPDPRRTIRDFENLLHESMGTDQCPLCHLTGDP